jgi:hypothetical protein
MPRMRPSSPKDARSTRLAVPTVTGKNWKVRRLGRNECPMVDCRRRRTMQAAIPGTIPIDSCSRSLGTESQASCPVTRATCWRSKMFCPIGRSGPFLLSSRAVGRGRSARGNSFSIGKQNEAGAQMRPRPTPTTGRRRCYFRDRSAGRRDHRRRAFHNRSIRRSG